MKQLERIVILLGTVIGAASCQINGPDDVNSSADTRIPITKSGDISYSIGNTTLVLSGNGAYSAIVSFNKGEYYSFSGFENMAMAYCPDFFSYDTEKQ